jgi:hypothetical protein
MALPLFFKRLRHDLSLEFLLEVHLLEPTVLLFQFFEPGHHRNVHAAVFGTPLVKSCRTDAKLTANIWHSKASIDTFERIHDLAIAVSGLLHIEPFPLGKILLPAPTHLRDDYPTNDLLLAKDKEGLLYWKTDTHWNNKGAFLAFTGFSKLLNLPPPNVSFKQGETHSGDLIGISKLKNFPLDPQDNWEVVWKDNPIWIEKEIPNEQKTTFGHATLVSNDKPISDQYVWVVGDSFASALKQYFNVTFSKVRYVGHWGQKLTTLPDEIDKAEKKPDLIVVVRVERSF